MKRVGLISGVSRSSGIGAAIARRLSSSHDLLLTGLPAYDEEQATNDPGDDPLGLVHQLRDSGARASYRIADLTAPGLPDTVVAAARDELGGPDTLVVAHAHCRAASLEGIEVETVERHLSVNVTATLMLVKAFVANHDPDRRQGRIVVLTSGQSLGPMPAELPYVASKGALDALVVSLADALAPRNLTVNAVNPGPTDTGLLSGRPYDAIRSRFPAGRWGRPEDAARLVDWLASDDAAWVSGQAINSEGGFRRADQPGG